MGGPGTAPHPIHPCRCCLDLGRTLVRLWSEALGKAASGESSLSTCSSSVALGAEAVPQAQSPHTPGRGGLPHLGSPGASECHLFRQPREKVLAAGNEGRTDSGPASRPTGSVRCTAHPDPWCSAAPTLWLDTSPTPEGQGRRESQEGRERLAQSGHSGPDGMPVPQGWSYQPVNPGWLPRVVPEVWPTLRESRVPQTPGHPGQVLASVMTRAGPEATAATCGGPRNREARPRQSKVRGRPSSSVSGGNRGQGRTGRFRWWGLRAQVPSVEQHPTSVFPPALQGAVWAPR